jgi:long-subunit acyl-CoA synthetase (AMP-forming)
MSPANIEAQIKASSPLIGQTVAVGDRRPYIVALVVLDPDGAGAWASEHAVDESAPAALAGDADVHAEIASAIDEANSHLSRVEQVKRFSILSEDWLPGGDELTPTMKLKRKPIEAKYADILDALYDAPTQ